MTLVPSGPPQITRSTLPTCRAQYPGGPGRVHMSVASPSRAAFPLSQAGRHPRLHFRGLLRLHSNYGPLDRSTAQGGLCHRASIHPVTRTNRLPATRSNRQLSGWFLPPLVMRAFWAHRDPLSWPGRRRAKGTGFDGRLSTQVYSISLETRESPCDWFLDRFFFDHASLWISERQGTHGLAGSDAASE